jgi:hypothetical protein
VAVPEPQGRDGVVETQVRVRVVWGQVQLREVAVLSAVVAVEIMEH